MIFVQKIKNSQIQKTSSKMKFSKSVVHALVMGTTAFASRGGDNEWTTIQSRMEPSTVGTQNFYGVKAHKDCNPQPLNPYMLIDKVSNQ